MAPYFRFGIKRPESPAGQEQQGEALVVRPSAWASPPSTTLGRLANLKPARVAKAQQKATSSRRTPGIRKRRTAVLALSATVAHMELVFWQRTGRSRVVRSDQNTDLLVYLSNAELHSFPSRLGFREIRRMPRPGTALVGRVGTVGRWHLFACIACWPHDWPRTMPTPVSPCIRAFSSKEKERITGRPKTTRRPCEKTNIYLKRGRLRFLRNAILRFLMDGSKYSCNIFVYHLVYMFIARGCAKF